MIIDSYLLVNFASAPEITQRLPIGWREYLGPEGSPTAFPLGITARPALPNPLGKALPEAFSAAGCSPGSDIRRTVAQHLDGNGIDRALVCHDDGRSVAALPHPRLCIELVRACNEWMLEEVLSADPRLFGTLLLPMHSPTESARVIREAAGDPRWAGVTLSANSLGQPFGHPIYHPVYEAAAETGLPIVIDAEADTYLDVMTNPVSGRPSTYTDLYALSSQSISTHVVSMISQGVFEMWPELKLFVVGGGISWITPLLWRFDTQFKAFHRDAPGLVLLPSEYFARNVRVGTYPVDRFTSPERLHRYLLAQPGLKDVLTYASGYPMWNRDNPADLGRWLPADWLPNVMGTNAMDVFRWPTTAQATAGTA
ncbi:amidohydrolase family protein [Rhodococcus koreensis]